MDVNNLPGVVTQPRPDRESNTRDRHVTSPTNAICVAPPRDRQRHQRNDCSARDPFSPIRTRSSADADKPARRVQSQKPSTVGVVARQRGGLRMTEMLSSRFLCPEAMRTTHATSRVLTARSHIVSLDVKSLRLVVNRSCVRPACQAHARNPWDD